MTMAPDREPASARPRTAFVTGAAGFVGRHLVQALLDHGWQVTAFCRPGDRIDLLPSEITVEIGDLTDAASVHRALAEGTDTVFHLAGNTSTWARNAAPQWQDNVIGTQNVVDAALEADVRRFVDTSSISAYGWQPGVVLTENSVRNVTTKGDPYGRSKRAAEQVIERAIAERGLEAVILNPVNVVGAGDAANWSRQLILPISSGTLRLVPPGSATWISVHDLVAAELAAADSPVCGNVILGGVRASFLEVVQTIQRILGVPVSRRPTPVPVLAAALAASEGIAGVRRNEPELSLAKYRRAIGDLRVDDSLARRTLALGRTSLAEMLGETIDWLREVDLLPPRGGDGWVPVSEEENHREIARIPGARVYVAGIPAGGQTRMHRHDLETLYVVLDDGRFRSDQARDQPQATELGRSISPVQKLGLLAGRTVSGGWLRMRRGTVLMQHHRDAPLIHAVHNGGDGELRMLGVELEGSVEPPVPAPGLRAEYADSSVLVLRVGAAELPTAPDARAVVVVVRGSCALGSPGEVGVVAGPRGLDCSRDAELLLIYP